MGAKPKLCPPLVPLPRGRQKGLVGPSLGEGGAGDLRPGLRVPESLALAGRVGAGVQRRLEEGGVAHIDGIVERLLLVPVADFLVRPGLEQCRRHLSAGIVPGSLVQRGAAAGVPHIGISAEGDHTVNLRPVLSHAGDNMVELVLGFFRDFDRPWQKSLSATIKPIDAEASSRSLSAISSHASGRSRMACSKASIHGSHSVSPPFRSISRTGA